MSYNNPFFPEIKGRFGFGFMRLPELEKDKAVDLEQTCRMVDTFLESGFNYFDTAHGYLAGLSELALRDCLTSRYPRDRYILTNKLSGEFFKTGEDIRPLLDSQLEACGVDYFDFYLMHTQNSGNYQKFRDCDAYSLGPELIKEGKIRHFGISFHDKVEVLEKILKENPCIEVVQIQFNYLDYESESIQSRACYEICRRYGKPVITMEPVRGGSLATLPEDAAKVIGDLNGGSPASYALRFAEGFDNMMMVLSGMSTFEQVRENTEMMKDFKPLDETEKAALKQVVKIFNSKGAVPCTGCRYCVAGCPKRIPIPSIFGCMNTKKIFADDWGAGFYYELHTRDLGKASDCIKCGKCEASCPQHLPIRELLKEAAQTFETKA